MDRLTGWFPGAISTVGIEMRDPTMLLIDERVFWDWCGEDTVVARGLQAAGSGDISLQMIISKGFPS